MASSGNFATINFQAQSLISTVTPAGGNLFFDGSTLNPSNYEGGVVCNFGMKGGKWYWETYLSGGGSPSAGRDWNVGFAPYSTASKSIDEGTYGLHLGNGSSATLSGYGYTQYPSGTIGIRHNNSTSSFGSAHTSGDVLGHALDLDNGTWIIYKNGSSLGTAATGIDTSLTYFAVVAAQGGTISNFDITCNFGQDSTFGGALSAGGNSDGNGFGDFKYSVPSGYLACSTANLSISSDIDPAQTDDDYPQKQFNVVTYTGNGSTNAITGLGFQPDLVWAKVRNTASNGGLVDSSRGSNKVLFSSVTNAEATSADISSFDSDGFTLSGSGSYTANFNGSSNTYVAWCWRANGGTTTSDSSGDITVTRQTNDAAKFSILTYTGNGSSGSTIAHGLGVKPAMTIIKQRNSSNGWNVWHQGYNNGDYDSFGELNSNSSWYANQGSNGPYTTDPTTSLLTLTAYGQVNGSSNTYVAYVWADVEGFQKFGSYVGNGNADGAFIYTGFRPRMIFLKRTDSSGSWHVFDTARNTFNPVDTYLLWDTDGTDDTASSNSIDFLSNGFKIRNNAAGLNTSGGDYVYGAWGDVPFKYNNTF
tara:strand:- start:18 stop:1781 length:1764 start_codon:yes stop_codon:yes gene_type:complete